MQNENSNNSAEIRNITRNISYLFILLFFIGDLYYAKKVKNLQLVNTRLEIQKDSVLYLQVNLENKLRHLNAAADSLNNLETVNSKASVNK